jgi:hypothetical protein
VSLLLRVQRFNENKLKEIWKTLHTGVDLDVLKNIIARVADAANLQVDLEKLTNE